MVKNATTKSVLTFHLTFKKIMKGYKHIKYKLEAWYWKIGTCFSECLLSLKKNTLKTFWEETILTHKLLVNFIINYKEMAGHSYFNIDSLVFLD